MDSSGKFRSDHSEEPPLTRAELFQLVDLPGNFLTLTAVPPGSGPRMALDRDLNGILNGDESRPVPESGQPAAQPNIAISK